LKRCEIDEVILNLSDVMRVTMKFLGQKYHVY